MTITITKTATIELAGVELEYFHFLVNIAEEQLNRVIRKDEPGGWKGMTPHQLQKIAELVRELTSI